MDWPDVLTLVSVSLGALFFAAGLIGMLRFPNALSRLHALSKVDNIGLGLVIIGLLPQASWPYGMLKLIALWLVVLIAGGAVGQMLAGAIHAEATGMRDGTSRRAGRDHRPRRRG